MNFRRLALAIVSFSALGFSLAQEPITAPMTSRLEPVTIRPQLWGTKGRDMQSDLEGLRFQWTSDAKDELRSDIKGMTFGGVDVCEALIRTEDDVPTQVTLFFYASGVSPEMNVGAFENVVERAKAAVSAHLNSEPKEKPPVPGSVVKREGLVWTNAESDFILEWSATKESKSKGLPFRGEFVRLTVRPKSAVPPIGEAKNANANKAAVKAFDGRKHVVRRGSETKLDQVPMVDQGKKGYCVVAAMERVLRYYGAQADQYELAQLTGADATRGTSLTAMAEAMRVLASRLGLRARTVYEMSDSDNQRTLADYNRLATKNEVPRLETSGDPIQDYARMDPALLFQAKQKQKGDYEKFCRGIRENIDSGSPLLWAVVMGVAQEEGVPQATGGHMRLILGYDDTRKTFVYSDSWGAGHEEKRISMEDAWTITAGLYAVEPTK